MNGMYVSETGASQSRIEQEIAKLTMVSDNALERVEVLQERLRTVLHSNLKPSPSSKVEGEGEKKEITALESILRENRGKIEETISVIDNILGRLDL